MEFGKLYSDGFQDGKQPNRRTGKITSTLPVQEQEISSLHREKCLGRSTEREREGETEEEGAGERDQLTQHNSDTCKT